MEAWFEVSIWSFSIGLLVAVTIPAVPLWLIVSLTVVMLPVPFALSSLLVIVLIELTVLVMVSLAHLSIIARSSESVYRLILIIRLLALFVPLLLRIILASAPVIIALFAVATLGFKVALWLVIWWNLLHCWLLKTLIILKGVVEILALFLEGVRVLLFLFLTLKLIETVVPPFVNGVRFWRVGGVFVETTTLITACSTAFHLN